MNKQIALSIEQMKHLQDLGLNTSDASLCWLGDSFNGYELDVYTDKLKTTYLSGPVDIIPSYTLDDILEKLPEHLEE